MENVDKIKVASTVAKVIGGFLAICLLAGMIADNQKQDCRIAAINNGRSADDIASLCNK
jgi:hypothetical protein